MTSTLVMAPAVMEARIVPMPPGQFRVRPEQGRQGLVEARGVDGVADLAAAQGLHQLLGRLQGDLLLGLFGAGAQVRHGQHVGVLDEGLLGLVGRAAR